LVRHREHPERDRQVERGAFLADIDRLRHYERRVHYPLILRAARSFTRRSTTTDTIPSRDTGA
jgi:hypothetical protein